MPETELPVSNLVVLCQSGLYQQVPDLSDPSPSEAETAVWDRHMELPLGVESKVVVGG